MLKLSPKLELPRCPHCSVNLPNLPEVSKFETTDHAKTTIIRWRCYRCESCGGAVIAKAAAYDQNVQAYYPTAASVDELLPKRPRSYLQQAIDSVHAPAGSVMLAASSVDAMLKLKGYDQGSLYQRIGTAAADHVITSDMATWAHEVRLDANDQRHADEESELPSIDDANRAIEFVQALAQFMFVLPAKVERGIKDAQSKENPEGGGST